MTNLIFYIPFAETGALASMITEYSVEELHDMEIIPRESPVLAKAYDPDSEEDVTAVLHIQLMKFNRKSNPTKVVPNYDLLKAAILEDVRTARADRLNQLDFMQQRALFAGKPDLVQEMEADKQILRDLPDHIPIEKNMSIKEIYRGMPPELLMDYEQKYLRKLQT